MKILKSKKVLLALVALAVAVATAAFPESRATVESVASGIVDALGGAL